MGRYTLTVGALMTILLALHSAYARADDIAWDTDIRRAWKTAQTTNRPLLLFVTSSHCPYCRKMKSDTLSSPEIVRRINDSYVPVVLNSEDSSTIAAQLQVSAVPTTLVMLPDGRIADRIRGYVSAAKLQRRLDTVLERMESH